MWSLANSSLSVTSLPWLLPGLALVAVASIAASGPVARWSGVRRIVAAAAIMSTGAILAGTVTPDGPLISGTQPSGSCDFSRVGPAGFAELTTFADPLINVLLFIPLGLTVALGARSSPRFALLLAGAFALSFVVETIQFVVTPLGRGCESADVADNLTGLVVGLTLGSMVAWLAPAAARALRTVPLEAPEKHE